MKTYRPGVPLNAITHDMITHLRGSISGAKVLAVGYSEPEIDTLIAPHGPREVVALTRWEGHRNSEVIKYQLVLGDICERTTFEAGSFDSVLTLSVFEHLADIPAALQEIARILTERGELWIFFGPAWSCAVGHHTYCTPGDPDTDFLMGQIPGHIHLLGSRTDMSPEVAYHVFDTDIINRVMFEDYLLAFREHFQLISCECFYHEVPLEVLQELRRRYPPYKDFSTYGGMFRLRKL